MSTNPNLDYPLNAVRSFMESAFVFLFPDSMASLGELDIAPCKDAKHGDYQCNDCLKLSKILSKPPRELALQVVAYLKEKQGDLVEEMQVAGPGFINIRLHSSWIERKLGKMDENRCGIEKVAHPQKIIVEFSSPNVAKELHVGHLRSTIIGDSLARVFEFLGHHVVRLNHIGDWGTAFGMLIAYIKENHLLSEDITSLTITDLMDWYRKGKNKFDQDPSFKKKSQLEVVALQGGDSENLHIWKTLCDISRKAFEEIYSLLDVKIQERGESFYNPYLAPMVKKLQKEGVAVISEGAICIFMEGMTNREGQPLAMIIQKSDGGFNYDTTDLAALHHRVHEEKADRIIVVTDAGQSLHFEMVFKAAQKAGFYDPKKVRIDHVPFGMVLGEDGKKFKTRSGEVEKLIDLLKEAIYQAELIFKTRHPDASLEEIKQASAILGIDAVKYADLSNHRIKDYQFSYEKMLRFEGNTAAFILYSYVRILGIFRKVGVDPYTFVGSFAMTHPSERPLMLHLIRFKETIDKVADDLLPNRLTDYLYELAEDFNIFFRDCRVEGSPEEKSRLRLCQAALYVLQKGLQLLGLKTLPWM